MTATANSPLFDAFWASTLARSRAALLDARVEPIAAPLPFHTFRVTYRGFDGVPIRAYLGVPIGASQPLPAIVTAPGYGGREFGVELSECQRGYLVLRVFPRGQGESGALWRVREGAERAWVNHGKENPEGFYYQGAYLDLVRGVDYLLTRPDADAGRVGLMGTSQGGMLALGAGALDPRARAVAAHVPYLCDVRHNPAFADSLGRDEPFLQTWDYFDPVRLAPRLRAATLLSAGGRDATCPPASIRAVFDALPGVKGLAHYPELTHTSSLDFYAMGWAWMAHHLR